MSTGGKLASIQVNLAGTRAEGLARAWGHPESLELRRPLIGKRRNRGLIALMHVQQHHLCGRDRFADACTDVATADLDPLAVEIQNRRDDRKIVRTLDLVQVV